MARYEKVMTFFRLQLYERVEISLVEVYKGVEKSVISVGLRLFLYTGLIAMEKMFH